MMETLEKKGIGGRDCLVINLNETDDGHISPLVIGCIPGGIHFDKGRSSFTISVKNFNELVEWLKSWDYI